MVRLSVLYPSTPGSRFDWDYYLGAHQPLVHRLCDPLGMVKFEVDRGVAGLPPGTPPPFHAIAYLTYATLGDLQTSLFRVAAELMGDLPKFTDVQPTMMIGEIV